MSFHHESLFKINYKIQSIAISDYPTIATGKNTPVPLKNDSPTRKQQVTLILSSYSNPSNVVINLELLAYEAEQLEKMHREDRYLVLSFNKIEEEEE